MNIKIITLLAVIACSVNAASSEGGVLVAKQVSKPHFDIDGEYIKLIYQPEDTIESTLDAYDSGQVYSLAKYIMGRSPWFDNRVPHHILKRLSEEALEKLRTETPQHRHMDITDALEWHEDKDWWSSSERALDLVCQDLEIEFDRRDEILAEKGVTDNEKRLYSLAKHIIDKGDWYHHGRVSHYILTKLSPEALEKLHARVKPENRKHINKALAWSEQEALATDGIKLGLLYKQLQKAASDAERKALLDKSIKGYTRALFALAKYIVNKSPYPVNPTSKLVLSRLTSDLLKMLRKTALPSRVHYIDDILALAK